MKFSMKSGKKESKTTKETQESKSTKLSYRLHGEKGRYHMRYDYRYEMAGDIRDYIEREFGVAILCTCMTKEDAYSKLFEELWVSDSVTGNASGSYTFNAYTAGEYLVGNWDLILEAMENLGYYNINPIEKGEEWCDVLIRCYLLGFVLEEVLDEYFEEEEEDDENE